MTFLLLYYVKLNIFSMGCWAQHKCHQPGFVSSGKGLKTSHNDPPCQLNTMSTLTSAEISIKPDVWYFKGINSIAKGTYSCFSIPLQEQSKNVIICFYRSRSPTVAIIKAPSLAGVPGRDGTGML